MKNAVALCIALTGMVLLGGAPVAAAQSSGGGTNGDPCEPIVLNININWSTFPPTVQPTVWIRPECLPV